MTDEELRKTLKELVDNAVEFYPHGNDGKECAELLIEFWMANPGKIKWAFWHGKPNKSKIIDCYDEPVKQMQVGGKGNRQVIG